MHRPLFDSEYIFGIHEPGGEALMLAAERPGWVLFSEAIGHDPTDRRGIDFRGFSQQGLGVICRINNGYAPHGSIPHSSLYEEFAQRVANFVATSRGCKIWVIGNEMNYAVERPGIQIDWSRHPDPTGQSLDEADPFRHGLPVRFNVLPDHSDEIRTTRAAIVSPGELITPDLYAQCYQLCRNAIHRLPGHEDDQVLVGAVAPWNTQTVYPGNPNGDWVQYFREIMELLGQRNCDGFTLHTYTHGADPALITSDVMLPPPFQNRHREFRAYMDFLNAVPDAMRTLPAYITETDQSAPWLDQNTGWIQRAYAEIDAWNQDADNQLIRALCLYRWPQFDKYYIEDKSGVIDDFFHALQHDYRWTSPSRKSSQPETRGTTRPARTHHDKKSPPTQRTAPAAQPSTRESAATVATIPLAQPQNAPPAATDTEAAAQPAASPAPPAILPYCAEWIEAHLPDRLLAGEEIQVPVTVHNAGSITWEWGGAHPFCLGYHYYRNRRRLPQPPERALRTDFPHDVAPDETVTVPMRIALPEEPGNYTLEVDVVHEGVTWFKEQNSPVLTRWLTVEAVETVAALSDTDGAAENAVPERHLPVPLFTNLSNTLPRRGSGYAQRNVDEIRYLVISHTAADPQLGIELIAQAHMRNGYPGIAYNFYIDAAGQILKVSGLDEVVQPHQPWSGQGVNICLAGDFSHSMPPLSQLDALGRLCAWLVRNLELSLDAIVGMGELIATDSPGELFYSGPIWKDLLLRQVRLNLAALDSSGSGEQLRELQAQAATLHDQNAALQTKLEQEQEEREHLRLRNEHLQAQIAQLQRELESQPEEMESGLHVRTIIEQLPRDDERYVARRATDVRYIVINHTGVDADVALHEIAEVHRTEWPGLLYDYVIDADGVIFQTQPLDEVVETDQPYLAQAINLAFAGNFDEEVPSDAQLYAGGQLIAWLLDRFPNVQPEQIRGISEFIEHTSPGEQWLQGENWKEMLLASVRRASGLYEPGEAEQTLRAQLAELEQRLDVLRRENRTLRAQQLQMEAAQQQLQDELDEQAADAVNITVPEPDIRSIIDQLPRHANLRYQTRARDQITHIAIHHTATPPTIHPQRIAEMHISADASRGKDAWPGIGYHFFIRDDGLIEQTNHLETISYHVYQHNDYALGVVFAGSFMNGKIPSSAQLRAGAHLVAWLMQELKIPLARVWGHREFPENPTVCPGGEWTQGNRWRDLLFERIEQIQRGVGLKSIRHYLLFWQRAHPGPLAGEDYVHALPYVSRFRPTLGFSVQDAKNAEYVTIVGNESGVSAADERALRNAGCKVERIAGSSDEETGRILAELARVGRRFREFEADF